MEKLRDPKQTVEDVLNIIAEENPDLPKDENIKPFFNDKKALKTRLDTIMFIMYKSLNPDVTVNEKNNEYLKCRHPRKENQSAPTFIDDLIKAGNINERVKEIHIEKTTPMPNVFDAIKNCLKDNKSPKIQGFIHFIDSEFLRLEPNARSTQDETEKMSVINIVEEAIKNSENSEKKQVIFTGAPGTGKTFSVEKYVKDTTKQEGSEHPRWEFVQFHSSYDYTDFVEGLRPVQIDDKMVFVRMDGTFKAFCRRVTEANNKDENYYFIIDMINRADLGRVFGELMYCFEKRGWNTPSRRSITICPPITMT